jgi:hypothetical protein
MAERNVRALVPVIQLLFLAALPAASPAFADADAVRVQFCWAVGKFDKTIYFAEAEDREDRKTSFEALIKISGIDHYAIECRSSDLKSHRLERIDLMKRWSESEFEIINTSFLSDLDC